MLGSRRPATLPDGDLVASWLRQAGVRQRRAERYRTRARGCTTETARRGYERAAIIEDTAAATLKRCAQALEDRERRDARTLDLLLAPVARGAHG